MYVGTPYIYVEISFFVESDTVQCGCMKNGWLDTSAYRKIPLILSIHQKTSKSTWKKNEGEMVNQKSIYKKKWQHSIMDLNDAFLT